MIDSPFGTWTAAAEQVLALAARDAAARHSAATLPEHLLLALLQHKGNHALRTLTALGVDTAQLRAAVDAQLSSPVGAPDATPPPLSAVAEQVLHDAAREARHLGHHQIDALHLLFGLLYEPSPAALSLEQAGVTLYDLRKRLLDKPLRFNPRQQRPSLRVIRPSLPFLVLVALTVGNGAALFWGVPEQFVQPCTILFVVSGWVTSVCIHEFAHALAAYWGGDESVRDAGYLTLNPLKYANPLFSIILPLVFLLSGGLGLPGGAVYINPRAFRGRWWSSVVSAAGPLGTLSFCLLLSWPFWLDWERWITYENWPFWPALAFLALLQVSALFFNLLPVPPLDGFGIIAPFFSWETRLRAQMLGGMTMLLFFMVLSSDNPLADLFWSNIFAMSDLLHIPGDLISIGYDQFFGS